MRIPQITPCGSWVVHSSDSFSKKVLSSAPTVCTAEPEEHPEDAARSCIKF